MNKEERNSLICRMYLNDKKINEISSVAKVSVSTIYNILDENNIKRKRDIRLQNRISKVKNICKLFDEGKRIEEISKLTRMEIKFINSVLRVNRKKELEEYKERERRKQIRAREVKRQQLIEKKKKEQESINNKEIQDEIRTCVEEHMKTLKGIKIAEDYVSGMSTEEIIKKHNITYEEYYYLFESSGTTEDNEERLPLLL